MKRKKKRFFGLWECRPPWGGCEEKRIENEKDETGGTSPQTPAVAYG